MKNMFLYSLLCVTIAVTGCHKPGITDNTKNTTSNTDTASVSITTDKAMYHPGDEIHFQIGKGLPEGTSVIYTSAGEVVAQQPLPGTTWTWNAPATDFIGYMVILQGDVSGKQKIYGTIGIDVSSDAGRFPRNGFLSEYGQMSSTQIGSVTDFLNRLHINWLQFQDWDWKHQRPLPGTVSAPLASWQDIANRTNYMSTVQGYIEAAHSHGIKTLSYNLCYGALNDAASDGVLPEWYLYTDKVHTATDVLNLPSPPFKSNIYLTNPANTAWQNYLAARNKDMYTVYDFDGYQIDQVGNRNKSLYDYDGNLVDLSATFHPFIVAMKQASPEKELVMNAVTQYGQDGIATSPVAFLYSEVWTPDDNFTDLARIIQDNNRYSNNEKQTVLAAYMDYNLADNTGFFNTPGVLFADAVIFAFGGAHLELGDHMLGKEYFPNDNLQMHTDLQTAMVHYYDFLVAYENILRNGGTFNAPVLSCTNNRMQLNNWPPAQGSVSIIGKDLGSSQVIHLVNFQNAISLLWRDADGTQTKPVTVQNAALNFTSSKPVKKLWYASPDIDFGAPHQLSFTQSGSTVSFTLPSLQYWDMLVAKY